MSKFERIIDTLGVIVFVIALLTFIGITGA